MTSWRAAYTGSERCVVPSGTILQLGLDVTEPTEQNRYELIHPPERGPYIAALFPSAVDTGLEVPSEHPEKWREVVYLAAWLDCHAENQSELEWQLIPESTRSHPKYRGYGFSIPLTAVGDAVEFLPDDHEIIVERDARLYVKDRFNAYGVRADGVATHCNVPVEVQLMPRHAVEKPHLVAGWEQTHNEYTWWRSDDPAGKIDEAAWSNAERVCPSAFLATCDARFAESVDADREWEALLVPTDLIGNVILVV